MELNGCTSDTVPVRAPQSLRSLRNRREVGKGVLRERPKAKNPQRPGLGKKRNEVHLEILLGLRGKPLKKTNQPGKVLKCSKGRLPEPEGVTWFLPLTIQGGALGTWGSGGLGLGAWRGRGEKPKPSAQESWRVRRQVRTRVTGPGAWRHAGPSGHACQQKFTSDSLGRTEPEPRRHRFR